jgi:hypothetical protein
MRVDELQAYKAKHGHCNVPHAYEQNPALGRWDGNQRVARKMLNRGEDRPKITAERVEVLDAMGLEWELHELQKSFDERVDELQAYKAKHGHCNVPMEWKENPALGRWVSRQRAARKRLDRGEDRPGITAERVEVLDAMGLEWELQKRFDERVEELQAYKDEHGDCNVPPAYEQNPGLGAFVIFQRMGKKRLDRGEESPGITAERVEVLDAVGLEWEPGTAHKLVGLDQRFTELQQYKREHGHCNVPKIRDKSGWYYALGVWLNNQRQMKRNLDKKRARPGITPERVARMTALGVEWSRPRGTAKKS